jgi:hypothetical protein
MTDYYVDPDVAGGGDGSAGSPWQSLAQGISTVNTALASDNVTVYFSAREEGSDTNQTTTTNINSARTDASTNRLTLDGMSKWNTSDSSPSWSDYSGDSKYQITHNYPINIPGNTKRNYTTIRGFRCISTEGQAIYYWGGDHIIIEYNHCTFVTPTIGPGIGFEYAIFGGRTCPGSCEDITIRYNTIEACYGEGMYVGGVENQAGETGHDTILIEGNVISNPGTYGGEADCLDVKDGNTNITIRGNTCFNTTPGDGGDGIGFYGNALIEDNLVYNCGRVGINGIVFWNLALGYRNGGTIRNNIIVNCGGNPGYSWEYGIHLEGNDINDEQWQNVDIYNNTIANMNGDGIDVDSQCSNINIHNNIIYESSGTSMVIGSGALGTHDNNIFYQSGGGTLANYGGTTYTAGTLTNFEANSLSSDPQLIAPATTPPVDTNFKIPTGSPAKDAGAAIGAGITDYWGVSRPQNGTWDIGAHEFEVAASGGTAIHRAKWMKTTITP